MAEAVRPTRKKRKAKKRSAEANDGLEYVQKDVQEMEKDTWAAVKEQETVLEVTSDDLNQKKEDGAAAKSAGRQAVDVNTKDDFLERDNGSSKERTLENILDSTEKENVDIKSNEGQAGSEKMEIKNKKSTEENNLVENKEVEDTEEQLGTIGLQEDIEGHVSTSKVEQGITNEDTELHDEQLGTKGATEDIVESKEETKTDLVGDIKDNEDLEELSSETPGDSDGMVKVDENVTLGDINDTEGTEGQQGTIEDSFTENVDLVTIRDTEDIEDHSGTIQGTHEELMEQMTYTAPTCMDEASSSAVVSGAIVQESHDLNISVLSEERQSSTRVLTQEKNLYGHIYNLFGKQQVSSRARETVTAFTEDDLKSFYYNPALTYVEDYVDEFIKDTLEPQRESEFYELLNTYQNSSKNLRNVESDIEILQKKCKEQKKTVWSTETKTVTVQGTCKDQQKVTFTRSYEVASFNMEQATKISRTLDSIKNTIHETFTLAKYSCQLARVHITSYIYELHAQSPVFCGISQESPVIGNDPSQVSHVVFGEIHHLRDCISALFAFLRRPTEDKGFYEDVDSWLQNLVALLLRVATLHDHIFLLNHVLRCPPGVTRKLAHFIQPLLFPTWATDLSNDEYLWHNPLLHHFVTTLATLLLPIKFREKYLLKMKALLTPDGSESSKSLSWVIVDEDGEEDENPEESWMLIPENDLVALFLQFPFDGLFKLIIGRDCFDGSEVVDSEAHGISRKTTTNVMQVFAFSTCLIEMLGKAFSLYSMRRYREFVKILGRAIRTIVMHVSRYWSVYKNHYINKYGDNETTFHLAFGSEYSLEKLQLEYDQFFIRASQQIFSAHKLGAWQFLIDMPFQSLSSKMTWTCYRFLHQGIINKDAFVSLSEYMSSHSEHLDVNDTTALVDCFKLMTEAEVVFLLTTFANMARARTTEDCDFITAVVREIYEVSYIDDKAPDFLPKTGKDLLGSICSSHPFVMSLLLERIEETLEKVREDCVPLFQTLPVETWRPKLRDIQTIRNWLLRSAVDSSEHQLSRYLLTNLNWQYQDLESDVLYLPRSVHRAVAILLVETCALRLSNRPGGIAVDVFKETPGIIEQVTQLATAPYQRIIQHYSDQDLYKWLWEVIMFLHLHEAECPASVMHFTNTSSSTPQDEGMTSSYDGSEFFKTLSKSEPLDLDTDEVLVNVLTSANKDGPLACYAALQLSSYGHDPVHLCGSGLGYISVLLEEGHVFATCRIIENVLPTFFNRDMLEFSETSRISKIIDTVIHSDTRWRNQDVLEIMAGIIQKHVKGSSVVPGTNRTLIALEFWLRTLCYLPNWNTDTKVLHLLNHLLKCVFRNSDAHQIVVDYFIKKHEDTLKSLKDQGFLSSLISFVTSNPSQANLVDVKAMSSYAYHCYYVLCAESIYQDQGGLKLALANKLHDKPDMCVETALKKVSSSIKDIVPIPSCYLDIYRWADLALSLDHDQPLLAIVWQKFFEQFLCRVPAGPGMPERGSVGLRFFESTVNTTYLKRLKARLMGTVEHHKALSTARSESNNEDTKYKTPLELHSKLAKLFQTLALWLDEPRIHDPTLFLKGLPPVYDSERLSNILNSHQNVWLECVDIGKIDWELNESVLSWMKFNKERQKKISAIQNRLMMKKIDRMSSKMTSLDDVVMPPSFQILSAPLPEFPISVLLDKQKIMETLSDNLHVLAEHARKFSMKFSVNSAFDFEYVDMLQHLYENPETKLRVSVPCHKKVCRGAAAIVVKFREKKLNDLVRQGAAQNREKYEHLIHEMLHEMPVDICTNALCVEKCLTLLLKQWRSCQNPALVRKFEMIGSSIFYMFIDMVSDGVRRFPPTMQFFSTCVELLGKAFIMENQEQTETLLRTILAHANIVGLLLPIFQPSTCQGNFAEMFENIIQTSLDVEVKFSLLSKFDFRSWLAPKPTLTERITMMKVLFAALCDCGFEPPVKTTMLSEIYLRKINVVLLYHFPDLFGETLKLLIDGSADHALCVNSWNEFLLTTKILIKNTTKRELELNTSPPFLLEHEQITETMAWLVEYYNDQRSSCSSCTTIEGLFTMWKPYLILLTALYEYLSRQSIAARAQELSQNDGHVIRSLWKTICDLFSPWIFPCQLNSQSVYPWSEMEVVQASEFLELYTRVLIYFQNFLSEVSSVGQPNVLSFLWRLYSSIVIKDVPPACVLRVYHANFTLMPWEAFCPTVSHLETMLQICNDHGNCRSFVGCIFPKISWLHVLQSLRSLGDLDVLGQFQACLFNLFLVLANEKSIIKVEGSEMITLLKAAGEFDWDLIDANTFSTCCNWLISNCDFVEILEPSSTIWCSLRLLQAACLLSDPVPSSHTYIEISEKRLHYLSCVVKLLCKCSSGPQHSPALFRPVIEQLMDNVLAAANSGETINNQNITAQYMEILNLLNQLSPREKVLGLALETVQEKIRDLNGRTMILAMIVAGCRSLASIFLMVQIIEVAVETHFNNIAPVVNNQVKPEESLVSPWSDILSTLTVPELSQREFVQECINHNAVLTLFAHVVQCLSQCPSAAQELNMLKDLTKWTASIKPLSPDSETKVILLWYKILQLIVRQVKQDVNLRDLGLLIDFIIPLITHAGEDRDTSGLLGVIGLGRKSPLTVNFRFLCRALSTFLSAQLPSNGIPRVNANSPGAVKDVPKKDVSSSSGVHASQRTSTAFHNLEGLRVNKTYFSLLEHVEFACKFISNPVHTLCDGPEFLKTLTNVLFKGKTYLQLVV